MSTYALVSAIDEVLRAAEFTDRPEDPVGKGWRWLPLIVQEGETDGYAVGAESVVQTVKPPPIPEPVIPEEISDRQFAHVLKNRGVITHAEAMAFVQTGTVPAALAAVVAAIPDQTAREDAELLLAGATVFQRHHPMTEAVRAAMGWTVEQVDALWSDGALL